MYLTITDKVVYVIKLSLGDKVVFNYQ